MAAFGLTVVRHGETRYNKEKILQGQGIDEPLSETGFRQADAAGIHLSNVRFTHAFASDLLRAKQTIATILRKSQFCKEIAVKYDARLRERKYGVAEGRPLSDLRSMAKAAGERCPSFTPPGGETLDELKARARDFFEYLCYLVAHEACLEMPASPTTDGNGTERAEGSCVASLTSPQPATECRSHGAADALDANILVVSHGAYMRNWVGYFVSDLQCTLPSTLAKAGLSSVSPNTGISQFTVRLTGGEDSTPRIHCVCLNRDDHLVDVTAEST